MRRRILIQGLQPEIADKIMNFIPRPGNLGGENPCKDWGVIPKPWSLGHVPARVPNPWANDRSKLFEWSFE